MTKTDFGFYYGKVSMSRPENILFAFKTSIQFELIWQVLALYMRLSFFNTYFDNLLLLKSVARKRYAPRFRRVSVDDRQNIV